jgi:NTE family protein
MVRNTTFFLALVLFLFANSSLFAQVQNGDTLQMPDPRTISVDTSLVFELDTHDSIPPMSIGLVLSGGGAKGLAHIGVLKVLEREGIPIDYIGGTSMGGLIGGLYAAGYSANQLQEIALQLNWTKLLSDEKERRDLPLQEKKNYDSYMISLPMEGYKPGLPKGLKEGQLVVNVLNKLTWKVNDINDFRNLPTPFFCVATDLETGDTVLIQHGDLPIALRATMSIPSIFAPVDIDGRLVIDGGIVNNFPVDIMLGEGLDYVIGVDVGAPLYKADEIESVINILDQISSYHQQKRYRDNVALTDLYVKPDISGLTAMSFEDVQDIIDRGERAAMAQIDNIRELARQIKNQKHKKRTVELKMQDTIFITNLEVEGLHKVGRKMVVGRLGLNIPGVNTIAHINAAIDRLYSSNYFEFINYKLIRKEDGYILHLNVIESKKNLFNIGGRYDTDLGASLLLNVELANILFSGSRLDFNLRLGSNPGGGIMYLVERGQNIGFGLHVHYDSRNIKTYSDDLRSTMGSYYLSFTSLDLVLFRNQSNSNTFIFGGTMEFMSVTSEVSQVPVDYRGDPYFNLFVDYIVDSYDDKYFPKKGAFFRLKPVMVTQYNKKTVFYANLDFGSVINLSNRISVLPNAFVGASWGGLDNTGYVYMLGGAGMNQFKNMHSFVGLPFSGLFSNNLLYGALNIRYNFYKNHYLTLLGNVASQSYFPEELFTKADFSLGTGLMYSLQTMVGPISLGVNISNQRTNAELFVNIGYYF